MKIGKGPSVAGAPISHLAVKRSPTHDRVLEVLFIFIGDGALGLWQDIDERVRQLHQLVLILSRKLLDFHLIGYDIVV